MTGNVLNHECQESVPHYSSISVLQSANGVSFHYLNLNFFNK